MFRKLMDRVRNARKGRPRRPDRGMDPALRRRFALEALEVREMPASLVPGGIVSGSIDRAAEVDHWTFRGSRGDRVELASTSTGRAGFTAFAEVYNPSGNRVGYFFPGSTVTFNNLTENGTYTVKLSDDDKRQTGQYTIGLEGRVPISPDARALTKGGIAPGTITAPIEKDQWTFQAARGDRVELISTSTGRAGFRAFAEVFNPYGNRVAYFFPGSTIALNLDETGTYVVQVCDDNLAQTGSYTIGLESISPPSPDARTQTLGTTVSGTLNSPIQKDQWLVNVPANRRLRVTLSGTDIDSGFTAFAEVYNSAGARIGYVIEGEVTFTLPRAGRYLIQVCDLNVARRGRYSLTARAV